MNHSYGIKQKFTFKEVLNNHDDQIIVRQLLMKLLPEEIRIKIIQQFNRHASEYNQRVIDLYGKDNLREGCLTNN